MQEQAQLSSESEFALYDCRVSHKRVSPKPYSLDHHFFMVYLDLDHLEALNGLLGVSLNWWNFYAFHPADRLPITVSPANQVADQGNTEQTAQGLKDRVKDTIHRVVPDCPIEKIGVLTQFRTLGYLFSPVSVFFCYDPEDKISAILLEVQNTFYESKPYVITERNKAGDFIAKVPKFFYVSPFLDADMQFEVRISPPEKKWNQPLNMSINTLDASGKALILSASLRGKRLPLTTKTLWFKTLQYPWVTALTIVWIHWHALRLWLKKLPFHEKHHQLDEQRGVLKPVDSLARHYGFSTK
ncbi:MAG: DUF1365 domain-containing protein [Cyanobacteria bacterium P01_H01_bin.74]